MFISTFVSWIRENTLAVFMLLGFVVGVALAEVMFAFRSSYTQREIMYVGILGEIYLNMLKGLGLLLIPSSLMFGLGNLDRRIKKGLAAQMAIYYLSSMTIATLIAILFTVVINPGCTDYEDWEDDGPGLVENKTLVEHLLDVGRNMFPTSLIGMFVQQADTAIDQSKILSDLNSTYWLLLFDQPKYKKSINIIGITTSALAAGIALRQMEDAGKPLLDALYGLSRVAFSLTQLILVLSPVLLVSLIASQILAMGGLGISAHKIGMYMLAHTLCLLTHTLCVPILMYALFLRQNPFKYLASMSPVLLTAFASGSSIASLPVAMKQMEQHGYDSPLVHVLMPIGTHLHKNGEVVSFTCGAIFVAQIGQCDVTWDMMMRVVFLSIATSISVVGVPRGGVVGQLVVLDSLSLPVKDMALLLTLDLFGDRLRTLSTVIGNIVCAAVLINYNKKPFEAGETLGTLPRMQGAEPTTVYDDFNQPKP